MNITPMSYSQLIPYILAAKHEGLLFDPDIDYYGAFDGGELIGFCGIKYHRHAAVLKCDYVFPQHRRGGILKAMIDFRLMEIKRRAIKIVTANCTPLSLNVHLRVGATRIKSFGNGIVKVKYLV
jgi:hypothetical protein